MSSFTPSSWENSQLFAFIQYLNSTGLGPFKGFSDLYSFSVQNTDSFWSEVLRYSKISASGDPTPAFTPGDHPINGQWFPNLQLNYAEYCLRYADTQPDKTCLRYTKTLKNCPSTLSFVQLRRAVAQLAAELKEAGVGPNDCVAAVMGNHPLTIISVLAVSSLGATWTCCAPNFGADAISSRLIQAQPKLLIADASFSERGKETDISQTITDLASRLPDCSLRFSSDLRFEFETDTPLNFERVSFNHPLWILYSSGTTGAPKAIIHRVGGMILKHEVEHRFHADLHTDDTLFYYTSTGWMMWNWMVSGLAQGAQVICHDDAPTYSKFPLWDIVQNENVSVFGSSAAYLQYTHDRLLNKAAFSINADRLKQILYTGSALSPDTATVIADKTGLNPQGICGGTDICGCFFGPAPGVTLDPAQMGPILGMAVDAIDEQERSIFDDSGDMICRAPFPAMPLGLLGDTPDQKTYKSTYYEHPELGPVPYWYHGDYVLQSKHSSGNLQYQVLGRSDATLNAGGVRIGSAEIYNALEPLSQIQDALVTTIPRNACDETIILFVQLAEGIELDTPLKKQIQEAIKAQNPYAVPKDIHAIPDIPYTLSGKKVEKAVKKLLRGDEVRNKDALRNPECLVAFEGFALNVT